MSNWHGGKGSDQRKTNRAKFSENYDKIFKKAQLDEGVQLREKSNGSGHSQSRGDNVDSIVSKQEGL